MDYIGENGVHLPLLLGGGKRGGRRPHLPLLGYFRPKKEMQMAFPRKTEHAKEGREMPYCGLKGRVINKKKLSADTQRRDEAISESPEGRGGPGKTQDPRILTERGDGDPTPFTDVTYTGGEKAGAFLSRA